MTDAVIHAQGLQVRAGDKLLLRDIALRVGDAMSENLVTARESDSLFDVLAAMQHRGVRRVPVTNAQGQLVGLLAIDDVLGVAAELLRTVAEVIETERRADGAPLRRFVTTDGAIEETTYAFECR